MCDTAVNGSILGISLPVNKKHSIKIHKLNSIVLKVVILQYYAVPALQTRVCLPRRLLYSYLFPRYSSAQLCVSFFAKCVFAGFLLGTERLGGVLNLHCSNSTTLAFTLLI